MGWQKQPQQKTIQGELERALIKISGDCSPEDVLTIASGRTDAGVHALGQVAKVGMNLNICHQALQRGLNSILPDDISVLDCDDVESTFHPIFEAHSKEYLYLFTLVQPNVFERENLIFFDRSLDIEIMKKACDVFKGTHDFNRFMCKGTPVKSTVREIYECEIVDPGLSRGPLHFTTPFYTFRVVGNGFLKQMVRLMVGSIVKVGQKKLDLSELSEALIPAEVRHPGKLHIAPVAPAHGLYLNTVKYAKN